MRPTLLLAASLVTLGSLAGCHDTAAPPATSSALAGTSPSAKAGLDARRQQLRDVIAEQWEYKMRTNPDAASVLGDKRYNDKWTDFSEGAIRESYARNAAFLKRAEAIDTTDFSEEERLNALLFTRDLRTFLEGEKFEGWLMPVNQFYSPHLDLAQSPSNFAFTSVKDYDDYVTRLRAISTVLGQVTENMRKGMAKGLMPARILLGKVAGQAEAIAKQTPEASVFAVPLASFPPSVPETDRARIRTNVLAAIATNVNPAYATFATFVRTEYEPHGRADVGLWSLPDGAARYAYCIEDETTTNHTADEIHEIGLKEVARIEAEMVGVAKKLGYADLASFHAAIEKNPALHFTSRAAVVDLYRKFIDGMYPKLPSLFGHLPKAKLEVLPMETFREASSAGADYQVGTPDGSRPGHVMIATGDFAKILTTNVETTAYHEGVPGHHLQLSIAQEMTNLPPFRQHAVITAFAEGWALYAERLAEDVGMYQDPYSYYGHLQDEMLRAIRLVVDTGIHAKKWTRQQAVDFFHAHSTSPEVEVQAETDRYIAIPGQALGYKLGQLEILRLRAKAKKELGESFDIRAFHDVVLDDGALPLDVLAQQVDRWIATRKSAPSSN